MDNLTKIQRIRFDSKTVDKLNLLPRFGINKSKFIRKAVEEKLRAELQKLYAEENQLKNLQYCPF